MKIQYESHRFRKTTHDLIDKANEIIDDYRAKGYNLTLRQLYYQFVARDYLPDSWIDEKYNIRKGLSPGTKNTDKNYKRLGGIINNGRLAGLISWASIVDRTRSFKSNPHWSDPGSILESARSSYAIDMWENQPNHVECWIEKEALIDVIARPCEELDVMRFACKGYSSQSASWRAAVRAGEKTRKGKKVTIIHL